MIRGTNDCWGFAKVERDGKKTTKTVCGIRQRGTAVSRTDMVTLPDQAERRSRSRFASRRATRRQYSGRRGTDRVKYTGKQCIVRIFTEDMQVRKERQGMDRAEKTWVYESVRE